MNPDLSSVIYLSESNETECRVVKEKCHKQYEKNKASAGNSAVLKVAHQTWSSPRRPLFYTPYYLSELQIFKSIISTNISGIFIFK